uniref:Uncharacterized protein n=1 Tax=Arundo donax TaxID=35708 RepID=A0A0A9ALJ2_ARUDO
MCYIYTHTSLFDASALSKL